MLQPTPAGLCWPSFVAFGAVWKWVFDTGKDITMSFPENAVGFPPRCGLATWLSSTEKAWLLPFSVCALEADWAPALVPPDETACAEAGFFFFFSFLSRSMWTPCGLISIQSQPVDWQTTLFHPNSPPVRPCLSVLSPYTRRTRGADKQTTSSLHVAAWAK